MHNLENVVGAIIRMALADLTSESRKERITAYNFLYRKSGVNIMSFTNLDANYLVKRYYGTLKPVKDIENYIEEVLKEY